MSIYIFPSKTAAVNALAERIVDIAMMSIHQNGRFSFVLSGGNTPKQLYETLTSPEFKGKILWSKVFFFLGDERYVPVSDEQSNYKMIRETLLKPLEISDSQVFSINTSLSPKEAAADYQQRILHYFAYKEITFDLILLGLGDNVHTASLFPHSSILSDRRPIIQSVLLAESDSYRITMNAPMINRSLHILFLVSGKDKALAVRTVQKGKIDWQSFPAQLIRTDLTDWYLDEAAADYL